MNYLANFLVILLNVLSLAIIIRAFMSWLPLPPDNPFVRIIFDVTEPILAPLRRLMPRFGMIDLTPLIALFIIRALEMWISSMF